MTRMEIYTTALDRQVIANKNWQNGNYRYIKIGRNIYRDEDYPVEINMLSETDDCEWVLGGQITKWQKFKFQIKLMRQLWDQIR